MNTTQTTVIEPGNRIRLPAQWAEALRLQDQVVLVKTDEGILVRPHPKVTWDDVFANNSRQAWRCRHRPRGCGGERR